MKSSELPRNDRDFINRLFQQLQAIFPAWRAAFPDDQAVAEAKRQWTVGLVQAGVTDVETVKAGLRIARRSQSPFIPSVGQFIGWCEEARADALSLPSIDEVQSQIINYASLRGASNPPALSIHPLAYWVYQNIDYYRWSRQPQDKADRMLEKTYKQAVLLAVDGAEFPEPPALISASSSAAPTAERRARSEAARASIRNLFA